MLKRKNTRADQPFVYTRTAESRNFLNDKLCKYFTWPKDGQNFFRLQSCKHLNRNTPELHTSHKWKSRPRVNSTTICCTVPWKGPSQVRNSSAQKISGAVWPGSWTHFRINGCGAGLAFINRLTATRKWTTDTVMKVERHLLSHSTKNQFNNSYILTWITPHI